MSNRSPRDAPRKEYGWIFCILASPRSHLCSLKNKSKSSSTYSGTARIPQYPIVGAAASAGGLLIPPFSVGSEGPFLSHSGAKKGGGQERRKAQRDGKRVCHSPFHDLNLQSDGGHPAAKVRSQRNNPSVALLYRSGTWAERHVHGLEVAMRFITRSERDNW